MKRRQVKIQQPCESAGEGSGRKKAVILQLLVLVIAAGLPFFVGKYIELSSPGAFDSGAYVYSAKHVLQGAKIGVEEKPSAKIGTLLMNMLGVAVFGFNDAGPKVVQGLLQLSAGVIIFIALKNSFGKWSAGISLFVMSLYVSAPVIAKYGNVKEQFMTAFMVAGMGFFILYHNKGRWWQCLLAGVLLSWGPLFKETGISAVAGVAVFMLVSLVFRQETFKWFARSAGLLLAGFAVGVGPIYLWMIAGDVKMGLPYESFWNIVLGFMTYQAPGLTAGFVRPAFSLLGAGDYVQRSREMFDLGKQAPIVMRYYSVLILPVFMGCMSVFAGTFRTAARLWKKKFDLIRNERIVIALAVWWLLDMAFVWISPRSYEQYYIPLCASGAVLGSYAVWLYLRAAGRSVRKGPWTAGGTLLVLIGTAMMWNVIFGISASPHWNKPYKDRYGNPVRRRGYVQRFSEAGAIGSGKADWPWMQVADHIRKNSDPQDRIYVWGWVPGIYVQAKRLSPAPRAFESEMHTKSPAALKNLVGELLESFKDRKPEFIVDTRKSHFPWDRPPLELWPMIPNKGFLPPNEQAVQGYEKAYSKALSEKIGQDEAQRFQAMKPLRDFVMQNYTPAGTFGKQVLFQLKTTHRGGR